jgi:cation:H+ antiporter
MILVAGATSLPEIITDVSVSLAGAPDLAVGDLFGSSMANMAILAVVDLLHRRRVWPRVEIGHAGWHRWPLR